MRHLQAERGLRLSLIFIGAVYIFVSLKRAGGSLHNKPAKNTRENILEHLNYEIIEIAENFPREIQCDEDF